MLNKEWTDDEKRETFIKEVSDLAFGDETIERGYSMQDVINRFKVFIEPNGFVRDTFRCLHNEYLRKNHTVHAYAEPYGSSKKTDPSSLWFLSMSHMKDLVDMPFKDYIHPEGDLANGYWDHCSIQKGTFDYKNMKEGKVFPTILYAHHETILTVACIVKTSESPDRVTGEDQLALYIYYPTEDNLEEFKKHKEVK